MSESASTSVIEQLREAAERPVTFNENFPKLSIEAADLLEEAVKVLEVTRAPLAAFISIGTNSEKFGLSGRIAAVDALLSRIRGTHDQ